MRILLMPLALVFGVACGAAVLGAAIVVWLGCRLLLLLIAGVVLGVDGIIRRILA